MRHVETLTEVVVAVAWLLVFLGCSQPAEVADIQPISGCPVHVSLPGGGFLDFDRWLGSVGSVRTTCFEDRSPSTPEQQLEVLQSALRALERQYREDYCKMSYCVAGRAMKDGPVSGRSVSQVCQDRLPGVAERDCARIREFVSWAHWRENELTHTLSLPRTSTTRGNLSPVLNESLEGAMLATDAILGSMNDGTKTSRSATSELAAVLQNEAMAWDRRGESARGILVGQSEGRYLTMGERMMDLLRSLSAACGHRELDLSTVPDQEDPVVLALIVLTRVQMRYGSDAEVANKVPTLPDTCRAHWPLVPGEEPRGLSAATVLDALAVGRVGVVGDPNPEQRDSIVYAQFLMRALAETRRRGICSALRANEARVQWRVLMETSGEQAGDFGERWRSPSGTASGAARNGVAIRGAPDAASKTLVEAVDATPKALRANVILDLAGRLPALAAPREFAGGSNSNRVPGSVDAGMQAKVAARQRFTLLAVAELACEASSTLESVPSLSKGLDHGCGDVKLCELPGRLSEAESRGLKWLLQRVAEMGFDEVVPIGSRNTPVASVTAKRNAACVLDRIAEKLASSSDDPVHGLLLGNAVVALRAKSPQHTFVPFDASSIGNLIARSFQLTAREKTRLHSEMLSGCPASESAPPSLSTCTESGGLAYARLCELQEISDGLRSRLRQPHPAGQVVTLAQDFLNGYVDEVSVGPVPACENWRDRSMEFFRKTCCKDPGLWPLQCQAGGGL